MFSKHQKANELMEKLGNLKDTPLKVAIVQRSCPHYRIPFFSRLNQNEDIMLSVLVNDPKALRWAKTGLGFKLVYMPALKAEFGYDSKSYSIPFSPHLIKKLWQERYDVLIVEGVTNILNNLLIYPVARLRRSRYIWWGAGRRRFAKKNILRRIADPFVNYLIKHADVCLAYGSVAQDYMVSVGAKPDRVFVAQNTIDTAPIFAQIQEMNTEAAKVRQQLGFNEKKIILYVGVIEKRKKIENLILAYREILKRVNQPVALVIVGDGPHLSSLRQWYEEKMPSLDVHFLGEIIEGVGAYFALCDVFVLPSEGGLALNQAMAYGKPVIATSADGTEIDLIQHGKNGYIVTEDDITALSIAILQVLENTWKQQEMSKASVQLIKEEFTLDNMVKGFIAGIEKVTGLRYEV